MPSIAYGVMVHNHVALKVEHMVKGAWSSIKSQTRMHIIFFNLIVVTCKQTRYW